MSITIRPLVAYLARIPELRQAKGLRHPLAAILCLCCVALMSGAKNPRAIAHWWQNRQSWGPFLERLSFTKSYGPSKSTLYRVLAQVPIALLEAVLTQWPKIIWPPYRPPVMNWKAWLSTVKHCAVAGSKGRRTPIC